MLNKGFSLIELILVIALLGILACLAYPSYVTYLLHARRHDGQTALFELANRMEHFHAEHHTYETATIGTGKHTDIKNNNLSPEKWYSLRITSQTSDSFSLQAIARNAQMKDKECQSLTLNHLGAKGTGDGFNDSPATMLTPCW